MFLFSYTFLPEHFVNKMFRQEGALSFCLLCCVTRQAKSTCKSCIPFPLSGCKQNVHKNVFLQGITFYLQNVQHQQKLRFSSSRNVAKWSHHWCLRHNSRKPLTFGKSSHYILLAKCSAKCKQNALRCKNTFLCTFCLQNVYKCIFAQPPLVFKRQGAHTLCTNCKNTLKT